MSRKDFNVDQYMTRSPTTVLKGDALEHALSLMQAQGIRHLPVMDGGALFGVLSEREAKTVLGIRGGDSRKMQVADACAVEPYVTHPAVPLKSVAQEMAEKRYGCAVVMELGQVVGIVTTTDLARALAALLP